MKTGLLTVALLVFQTSFLFPAFGDSPAFIPADPVAQPSEWRSSFDGNGVSDGFLQLGSDNASSDVLSAPLVFQSRKLYRSSFKLSQFDGSGGSCACCGTEFFNFDFSELSKEETPSKEYSVVFFTPDGETGERKAAVRFGKWESKWNYKSSMPKLVAVQPVFKLLKNDDNEFLTLGDGESIDKNGVYNFVSFKSSENTNYDRTLFSTTASFNTLRWGIGLDNEVVYCFCLEPKKMESGKLVPANPIPFTSGSLSANVCYWVSGVLCVEVSLDLKNWTKIGEVTKVEKKSFSLDGFLGDKPSRFFVRFRGSSGERPSCNLQLNEVSVSLQTDANDARHFEGGGETMFGDLSDEELDRDDAPNSFVLGYDDASALWICEYESGRLTRLDWDTSDILLKKERKPAFFGADQISNIPQDIEYSVKIKRPVTLVRKIYPYFNQNYTKAIKDVVISDDGSTGADVSWCESDYHVPYEPKLRTIQTMSSPRLEAARNDSESLQLVLHSGELPLRGVNACLTGELKTSSGDVISSDNVELRYAYYHNVVQPTDATCSPGWYPDALIPFEQGGDGLGSALDVEPFHNFLVWITVKTPSDAKAGLYASSVKITANEGSFSAIVPFELALSDFTLPVKNTLETAYGLSYGNINNYHNLKSTEDKRTVYEKYLKIYSDYRISMYNPVPLDGIRVKWLPDANPPSCEVDFSSFDEEIKRVFEKYHFTNFSLPLHGLGGGTYQSRYEGSIAGFREGTPEYETMFADYVGKIQDHLSELGLLDAAYVYCFDEPDKKDYEFVAGQFARLKKYAPKINLMLTEEPSSEFEKILKDKDASIDIWCPVSPNYSDETAKPERNIGNRFWWYVCCYPKAPYCTEFTDHSPLELRLWHWQTFERNISGCLVWSSNYWTSSTAFPDSFQNPYEDPASYVSDGSMASGTKSLWGNGDGRFIYPPLSAATPGRNEGKPIFDGPCASIRWEMIREGVEDYEMLTILKKLLEEKSDKLSSSDKEKFEKLFDFSVLSKDMTHFTNDPQILRQRRSEVMQAIVRLQRI